MKIKIHFLGFFLAIFSLTSYSAPDNVELLVWANEAIVTTYTSNYKTYMQEQKKIAQYFTSDGWIAYSKALNASKLPATIQSNSYDVTAVATAPPQLNILDQSHWTVVMPILVQYQNPQYQQQQNLKIILGFTLASTGQGIRGFAITSLQSKVIKPPCQCVSTEEENTPPTQTEKQS